MNNGFYRLFQGVLCSCVGVLSIWCVSLAAGQKQEVLAEAGIRNQSLEISFNGPAHHSVTHAEVKVTGPDGASFTRKLEGSHDYIDFGQYRNMTDGTYTYELYASYNPRPANSLNNGRGDVDEYQYDTVRKFGSFVVKNGVIENAQISEEE